MQTNDQKFFQGSNGKAVLLIHGITSGSGADDTYGKIFK